MTVFWAFTLSDDKCIPCFRGMCSLHLYPTWRNHPKHQHLSNTNHKGKKKKIITLMLGQNITTSLNNQIRWWKSPPARPGVWWDEISQWTVGKTVVTMYNALKHLKILSNGSECSRCISSLFTSPHSYATPWQSCPFHITEWELDEMRHSITTSWWTLPKSIETTVKQLHIMSVTPPCMTTWPSITN